MIKKEIIEEMFILYKEKINCPIYLVQLDGRCVWMYEDDYKKYTRKLKIDKLELLK
jgi:hypothetical protein